jgi:hypothetical protein
MSSKKTTRVPNTSGRLTLENKGEQARSRLKAEAALSPALNAAIATESYQRNLLDDNLELVELADVLKTQAKQVHDGDLSGLEAMLVGQATAPANYFHKFGTAGAGTVATAQPRGVPISRPESTGAIEGDDSSIGRTEVSSTSSFRQTNQCGARSATGQ